MRYQSVFLLLLSLILSISDAVGHTDFRVGGERIRFERIPLIKDPRVYPIVASRPCPASGDLLRNHQVRYPMRF